MKGIKLGILGIAVSLLGIVLATNHIFAIAAAAAGAVMALAGCLVKDE